MQLTAIEYVHNNSTRVAGSVAKPLRYVTACSSLGLQRCFGELSSEWKKALRDKAESDVVLKYFDNIVGKSAKRRAIVKGVDFCAPPSGSTHPALN